MTNSNSQCGLVLYRESHAFSFVTHALTILKDWAHPALSSSRSSLRWQCFRVIDWCHTLVHAAVLFEDFWWCSLEASGSWQAGHRKIFKHQQGQWSMKCRYLLFGALCPQRVSNSRSPISLSFTLITNYGHKKLKTSVPVLQLLWKARSFSTNPTGISIVTGVLKQNSETDFVHHLDIFALWRREWFARPIHLWGVVTILLFNRFIGTDRKCIHYISAPKHLKSMFRALLWLMDVISELNWAKLFFS